MLLALAIKRHPAQVRADLQRFYGLNLDRMGAEFSAYHAADCLACLPHGSAFREAVDPSTVWTDAEYFLHGIVQMLAGKEIPYPWEKSKTGIDGVDTEAVPLDEFYDWYTNSKWKEVEGWQIQ